MDTVGRGRNGRLEPHDCALFGVPRFRRYLGYGSRRILRALDATELAKLFEIRDGCSSGLLCGVPPRARYGVLENRLEIPANPTPP